MWFAHTLLAVPLVLGGALAAASGRFVLANGARRLAALLGGLRPGEGPTVRLWGSADGEEPRGS